MRVCQAAEAVYGIRRSARRGRPGVVGQVPRVRVLTPGEVSGQRGGVTTRCIDTCERCYNASFAAGPKRFEIFG